MIIIEGPDHTGKTTLAKLLSDRLSMPYYHFAKDSTYHDYLKPLCNLDSLNIIADRWVFSEIPYSRVMGRKFAFSLKEWHNLVLLTLAQNPTLILCVNAPNLYEYPDTQYLPFGKWVDCLQLYRKLFEDNSIEYIEYDYSDKVEEPFARAIGLLDSKHRKEVDWWVPMWKAGYGFIGSMHPEYLLVAERIGPNNVNNLPFETGPTGHMLSDMLDHTGTPLGKFAVTNMVKSFRRDTREPNDTDVALLKKELEHLKPRVAVFMGAVSKQYGAKVAKDLGIESARMTHFGYYSHRGITDISPLCAQWTRIIGKETTVGEKGDRPAISFTTESL